MPLSQVNLQRVKSYAYSLINESQGPQGKV